MPTINCTSCVYPRVMTKAGLDRHSRQRYRCPMCGTRKEPPQLRVARPGGVYKPLEFSTASELFLQGFGCRKVIEVTGLSSQTVKKYRRIVLQGKTILCACGRTAGHQGWCDWRVSQSPARQAYYAKCAAQSAISLAQVRPRVDPILTTWPFVRSFDNDDYALLKAVNEIVPRSIPEHVRADVCQDILMDIVSGELSLEFLPHRMREYTRKAYGFMPSKFGPKSLDSFIFGDEGRTLADVLEG